MIGRGEVREVTDVQVGGEMETPATDVGNQEEAVVRGKVMSLVLTCCI